MKLIQGDFVDRFHQSHPSRVRGLKPVIVYDSSKSPVAAARLSEDLPPVDELYLEADEDYLKVGGLHAQARLVYFHEGVAEHPRRHLINARCHCPCIGIKKGNLSGNQTVKQAACHVALSRGNRIGDNRAKTEMCSCYRGEESPVAAQKAMSVISCPPG